MPRFQRVTVLLASAALVGAACSGGSSSTAPPASTTPSTTPSGSATAGPARRWGDGRALAARVDPDGDRTVVATTIGVSLQTGDADPVVLAEGLPSLLAIAPDGRRAAFTIGGRLEVWDLDSGAQVAAFDVGDDQYTSLAFSSPTDVVAGGEDDVTRFPSDGTGPEVLVAATADGTLGPVALGADGAVAVPVQAPTPTVAVWRPGSAVTTLDTELAAGTSLVGLVWSGDGSHLAVLQQPPSEGESVAVWDVAAAAFTGRIPIANYVTAQQVVFQGPDRVVVPLADRTAAFDLAGNEVEAVPIPAAEVATLQSFPTGEDVAVTGWDGRLQRWTAGADAVEVAPASYNVVDQSVPHGTADLVVVDHYGSIRSFDGSGEIRRVDRYAVGEANSVDVAPGSASVAMATSTGAVRVLRASDGSVEQELDRPEGNVAAVAFAPDGPLLASGLGVQIETEVWNDAVAVTDLTDDRTVAAFGGEQENVAGCSFFQGAIDFSPDGKLLAASSHDYRVEVTSLGEGSGDVQSLEPHLGTVLDVEFSPDGTLLATSSEDGTLRFWDVGSMTLRDELTAAPGGYWALAFSPDGSTLAVSDVGGTISLLDVASGDVLRTFSGTKAQQGDMEFTPDGSRLVAGGPDGAVDVWSVEQGGIAQRLVGHTMRVTDVAVNDDGSAVATSSLDGTVRYWPLGA